MNQEYEYQNPVLDKTLMIYGVLHNLENFFTTRNY